MGDFGSYPGNKRVEVDHISRLSLNNGFLKLEEKLSPNVNVMKVQNSLKHEITDLEKILQRQFDVRNDLEMALGYRETSQDDNIFTPKPTSELIKEIATLELEVSNLEQYLLWLYRKAFGQQASYIANGSSIGIWMADHIPIMTPNKLSEEMIKYVSTMYCKYADTRFLSSTSKLWSFRKSSAFDDQFESCGPYNSMIEVSHIKRKGHDFELMLRQFRLLTKQLEDVDLRKLTHQEKLAFWINVHNSLVMHTFLVNGIPRNNGKRFLLFSKPAYNIGGRVMSIDLLQNSILLSRMPCPQQWLRLLLTSKKRTTRDDYQEYSLEHPEPLLYFALCSGNHSDPAVRVYTAESIYLELETAKEEYIRANIGFRNDQKLILPKIIESFSKDLGLNQAALMETIQECLPEPMRYTIKKLNMGRSRKSIIESIPHNFGYRYLIARELIK
ncbi:PREDICTED: uncharacterized protein LOC104733111 [Camelina sativa]|uniref:Uncharacterized protein LOC104733111 n=1 Tax=Camelina sativa TaxID=90675 RepID=A0ABM0V5E9_CAMSA|nr:PREDICTED: uncharacterized protein LOC104733111 [Camelina sativa]